MNKGTISVRFVTDALFAAQQRGLDVAAILAQVGLPPELLDIPQARVSPSNTAPSGMPWPPPWTTSSSAWIPTPCAAAALPSCATR